MNNRDYFQYTSTNLPANKREKYEFYENIAFLKKELAALEEKFKQTQADIQQKKLMLEQNIKKIKDFPLTEEKFINWKNHQHNELEKAEKEKVKLQSEEIDRFAAAYSSQFAELELKKDGAETNVNKCTSQLDYLENTIQEHELELIKLNQLEKKIIEGQENLLSVLTKKLEPYEKLSKDTNELFNPVKNHIQSFKIKLENNHEILDEVKKKKEGLHKAIQIKTDSIQKLKLDRETHKAVIDQLKRNEELLWQKIENDYQQKQHIQPEARNPRIIKLIQIQNKIRDEIQDKSLELKKYHETLFSDNEILKKKWEEQTTLANEIENEMRKIRHYLDSEMCFASAQYINKNLVNNVLYEALCNIIHDPILLNDVVNDLIEKCHWNRIAHVSGVGHIKEILIDFYNQRIKPNKNPNKDYAQLFDVFLATKGIAIENAIPIKHIVLLRTLDSLTRFFSDYIKYQLGNNEMTPVFSIVIWKDKIKIAINETEKNTERDQNHYENIKTTIHWLEKFIDNCPSDVLQEQEAYTDEVLKTTSPEFQSVYRCPTNLLNILQFHSSQKKHAPEQPSLLAQLQQVTENDVCLSHEGAVNFKNEHLHAELVILKQIAIDHLLECIRDNKKLSLFPDNLDLLLGVSKLNCATCCVTIDALNHVQNAKIITTGKHHLRFNKSDKIQFFMGQKFIEGLIKDLKMQTTHDQALSTVIQFLEAQQLKLSQYIQNTYENYVFIKPEKNELPRFANMYPFRSPHDNNYVLEHNGLKLEEGEILVPLSTRNIVSNLPNTVEDNYVNYTHENLSSLMDFEKEPRPQETTTVSQKRESYTNECKEYNEHTLKHDHYSRDNTQYYDDKFFARKKPYHKKTYHETPEATSQKSYVKREEKITYINKQDYIKINSYASFYANQNLRDTLNDFDIKRANERSSLEPNAKKFKK